MKQILLREGHDRTEIHLSAQWIGEDLIVCLFNKQGHLGAVAVADFSHSENRASTSVITRLGHKDDAVASQAAYNLCKRLKKPVCAIAGIHLDNITDEEIEQIVRNCDKLVDELSRQSAVGSKLPTAD